MSALPINQMMEAVDYRNKALYSTFTEEQKKAYSTWLIMRHASSASKQPEHYLLMVNEFVNVDFSALRHHPELQWMLLALCGAGSKEYHPWIAPAKKKKKNKVHEALVILYPTAKEDELVLMQTVYTQAELIDLFMQAGYQDKEVLEIFE